MKGCATMANKITKRDFYAAIIKMTEAAEGIDSLALGIEVESKDGAMNIPLFDVAEFCRHEIDLLDKKRSTSGGSRKPTKTQLENETYKAKIVEILAAVDEPMTIKAIQNEASELADFSTSKMSALLTALIKAGTVERSEIKRVAHFSLATAESEDAVEE